MVLVLQHIWQPKTLQACAVWLYGATYTSYNVCKVIH